MNRLEEAVLERTQEDLKGMKKTRRNSGREILLDNDVRTFHFFGSCWARELFIFNEAQQRGKVDYKLWELTNTNRQTTCQFYTMIISSENSEAKLNCLSNNEYRKSN